MNIFMKYRTNLHKHSENRGNIVNGLISLHLIICFTNRYNIPIYVFGAWPAFVYSNQADDV